ncbi:MAG: hypothetical protein ABJP86_15785 [Flavobacteriaceae bacterium]
MRKLLCMVVVFTSFVGCKNDDGLPQEVDPEALVFNYQKMPKKFAINPEATAILEEWVEFTELTGSFDVLYKAKNNEDLILAIDDLIEKEKLLAKAKYPEPFDQFQIKSTQRVLKTYILKVKSSLLNHTDTTEPAIEMLVAYNAMRRQFNVIVNGQLDKKMILNES